MEPTSPPRRRPLRDKYNFAFVLLLVGGQLAGCHNGSKEPLPDERVATLDLSKLSREQQAVFDALVTDEICPCGCPTTFKGCLNNSCDPGLYLAQWMADELVDGTSAETLAMALGREITSGFTSAPRDLVTTGYAHEGAAHPRYTIVEYADFECSHCQRAALSFRALIEENDEVAVVFKHFPLDFHPMARKAAAAAEAAGEQGQFWPMHDALFATQLGLDDEMILSHAKALKLDMDRFVADVNSAKIQKRIDDSIAEGKAYGVNSTPALFLNGRPFRLSRDRRGFATGFAMEASRSRIACQ